MSYVLIDFFQGWKNHDSRCHFVIFWTVIAYH